MAICILLVDDEPSIVKGLKYTLDKDGYDTTPAYDGKEALELFAQRHFDLVLLDVMLPEIDGIEVCQRIRERSDVPIIMLTAKGDDMDKIMGLEYGADDYMTKPFNVLEVKARIKSVLRRSGGGRQAERAGNIIEIKGLVADFERRQVSVQGRQVSLTVKEFDILQLFMTHPGRVFSRADLLEELWETDFTGDLRVVDVHVRRLREKIEPNPAAPEYIITDWGIGYHFAEI